MRGRIFLPSACSALISAFRFRKTAQLVRVCFKLQQGRQPQTSTDRKPKKARNKRGLLNVRGSLTQSHLFIWTPSTCCSVLSGSTCGYWWIHFSFSSICWSNWASWNSEITVSTRDKRQNTTRKEEQANKMWRLLLGRKQKIQKENTGPCLWKERRYEVIWRHLVHNCPL